MVLTAPCALLLASSQAVSGAATFGRAGQLVVQADVVLPLLAYTADSIDAPARATDTSTGSSITIGNSSDGASIYSSPRVGIDGAIGRGFTLGTGLTAALASGHARAGDPPSVSLLGVLPRAGYVVSLHPIFSLWLQAGLFVWTATQRSTDGSSGALAEVSSIRQQLAASFSASLVVTPWPGFGMTVAPIADVGLHGTYRVIETSAQGQSHAEAGASTSRVGIAIGALAYF